MAYRHLLLLGGDGNGGASLDLVDLGPAKVNDTVPGRVLDHLRSTDRLARHRAGARLRSSPTASVCSPRATRPSSSTGCSAFFYRLPRLPKLASADVLRSCLVQGVENGTFGLASGASWNAPDAVLRFAEPVDPTEVQFQPGTWLVRAAAIKALREERRPEPRGQLPRHRPPRPLRDRVRHRRTSSTGTATASTSASIDPTKLTVRVSGVSADKIRDVIKVAVMPLAAGGADVSVTVEVDRRQRHRHSRGTPSTSSSRKASASSAWSTT